jgi:hypothetical protein
MWIDYTSNSIGYGATWSQVQEASSTTVGSATTWRIDEPIVTRALTQYDGSQAAPAILFKPGDTVDLIAGGCVQTGGSGKTWKRYVNPTGPNSTRLYFGEITIPGVTDGLVALRNLGCQYDPNHPDVCTIHFSKPTSAGYLQLGYTDDGYSDNGYWGHDDGTEDQCKNVGNAYLTLTVHHAQ